MRRLIATVLLLALLVGPVQAATENYSVPAGPNEGDGGSYATNVYENTSMIVVTAYLLFLTWAYYSCILVGYDPLKEKP